MVGVIQMFKRVHDIRYTKLIIVYNLVHWGEVRLTK